MLCTLKQLNFYFIEIVIENNKSKKKVKIYKKDVANIGSFKTANFANQDEILEYFSVKSTQNSKKSLVQI